MTKEKKEAFLILRVSIDLKKKLQAQAVDDGVSLSELVRQLLDSDG